MGREIRKVPADWKHPFHNGETWTKWPQLDPHHKRHEGFHPMYEAEKPYLDLLREYVAECEKWERGERPNTDLAKDCAHYWDYGGGPPDPKFYMPFWPAEQRTHYQMYEDTSEGTPISPVFATPEEVARWCVDNGVSIFGRDATSYETWLRIARGKEKAQFMVATSDGWKPGIITTDDK